MVKKRQKRIVLVCMLSGTQIIQSQANVNKQARKLKFENVDDYINFYISKEARKLIASGQTELEIRKQFKCKETKAIPFHVLKCFVKKFKTQNDLARKRQRKAIEEYNEKPFIVNFKGPECYNLVKNKEMCENVTRIACWRPDIYLDYGCLECILKDNCICPIKNLKRKPNVKRTKKLKSI